MTRKRRLTVAAVALVGLVAAFVATPTVAETLSDKSDVENAAAGPKPVYKENFADPAVIQADGKYVAVATGALAPMLTAPKPSGPWKYVHGGLKRLPKWANGGGVWAPEIRHVKDDTYVMFYAAKVTGLVNNKQRCIGVAVSTNGPDARYTPVDSKPLVCPPGSDHPGFSKPVTGGVGFIDPSTFTTKDGRNVLLFKSQYPNPGTKLWSVELNADWTKPTSSSTVLLSRAKGQIENPEMVVRDDGYYLFASYDDWDKCEYKTVWLKNKSPRAGWKFSNGFPGKTTPQGGTLIASKKDMCGPGGMTIAWHNDKHHFFLHAYRDADGNGKRDSDVRRMYAGNLVFKANGVPAIKWFYSPA